MNKENKKTEGFNIFDAEKLDEALDNMGWSKERLDREKCLVCGRDLNSDSFGAFVPRPLTDSGRIRATCDRFQCLLAVLLKSKKEELKVKEE